MVNYLKIAWRNILRNKRRTLITASSIFFAAFLAIVMRSFQLGSYNNMIFNIVETYSGYLQIQNTDYFDDQSIDNLIEETPNFEDYIKKTLPNIKAVVPRLQYFSLISVGKKTKGIAITGINPEKENAVSKISDRIVKYRINQKFIEYLERKIEKPERFKEKINQLRNESYTKEKELITDFGIQDERNLQEILNLAKIEGKFIGKNDKAVLVSDRLAKFLQIGANDTIVLYGQGYHGVSAAGKYVVNGIVKIPNPQLDKRLVFMPLKLAQEYFSSYKVDESKGDTTALITCYIINLSNNNDKALQQATESLKTICKKNEVVKNWKEMNKQLVQQIESDNTSGLLIIGILYLIISFGILGTVLMMTAERKHEMGVMTALGMKKYQHSIIVTLEMIFISWIGTLAGMIASAPIIMIGYYFPIRLTGEEAKMIESYGTEATMPTSWFGTYYYSQALIVLAIVAVVMIYPIITIFRIKITEALKS